MSKQIFIGVMGWLFYSLLFPMTVSAQLRLPRLCGDGMVLQRDEKIHLWGWADPSAEVNIEFNKKDYHCRTSQDGKWQIDLPAQAAGGPFKMTINSAADTIRLKDIIFGDVWLCSGQSNMEHDMASVYERYSGLIDHADYPMIRQFKVPAGYDFKNRKTDLASGKWHPAVHDQINAFTAVGFFFALEIFTKTKVPVGLINASLGGSPIEAWLPAEVIKAYPKDDLEMRKFQQNGAIEQVENMDRLNASRWQNDLNRKDKGEARHWKDLSAGDLDWKTMSVPGYWSDQGLGLVQGVVWFKKRVFLENKDIQKKAKLVLGRMVDADSVFINGTFVGSTGYQYPRRRYTLPARLLHAGENTITIRMVNQRGKGGFVPDKVYGLVLDRDTISLAGLWKYRLGAMMPPAPPTTFVRWKPTGLFNGMLAPLFNYPIKGVLWYQGESNADSPLDYGAKLKSLIRTLRLAWSRPDLPFLYVQLPNFLRQTFDANAPSGWAMLREQQRQTLVVPYTGMAVTIDLGEWNDIHPLNKQDVGRRLAYQAEHMCYGKPLNLDAGLGRSPLIESASLIGQEIALKFKSGCGLRIKNGDSSLHHFAIAPENGPFVWADARIEGDSVWVSSPVVKTPKKVRYGWADNPLRANLENKAGLPASPFEITAGTESEAGK